MEPLQRCTWDMSCLDWCGDGRRLSQCPARLPSWASSALHHGHSGEPAAPSHQPQEFPGFVSAPVSWLCRCSAPDMLQQAGHCLGQDLLQLLPLPSTERRQDIVGHCHITLRPPDADPEPGHLLGRKEESWGSVPSSVQTELGNVTILRVRLGSKGAAPHVFQVVLSACSKKHNFGRGFC